jgi:hypothetical protein
MAVGDTAFGEVVRGQFHRYAITGEDSDSVTAEFAGQVGKNGTVGIELNAE